jgi:cyclase
MLRNRVIPVLLSRDGSLVKTVRFGKSKYVGDPCNTVRIFNELEVDELTLLDISKDRADRGPDLTFISALADECFMPLSYGGGIRSLNDARAVFASGVEKVIINTAALENPTLISEIADIYGSQSVVVSIDAKRRMFGSYSVCSRNGKRITGLDPVDWAQKVSQLGAGEILLTSVDREGTWSGFDLSLIHRVSHSVMVPLIAHGGAGTMQDIRDAVVIARASAVALGTMVVFQKRGNGVLVNFPESSALQHVLP